MKNVYFRILVKFMLFIPVSAFSENPGVIGSRSAFSIFVKKIKKNRNEEMQVEVFKNGAPFPIKAIGNIDVSGTKKARTLTACLKDGRSTYSRKELKYQQSPVGWMLKRGVSCTGQVVYRHRIIAIQPNFDGTYEWEIESPHPIEIKETSEGLDFWMIERITRKSEGENQKHLYIPSIMRLKIEWAKRFDFAEARLPDNPSDWIPLESVESNFQTFFMVGLREFNFRLMNFAIKNYFSPNDRFIYEKWGLPTQESSAKKLAESLEQISTQSDALISRSGTF